MDKKAIVVNPKDSVATLLSEVTLGDTVTILSGSQDKVAEIKSAEPIPYGHKIALRPMQKGTAVIKFGNRIGHASKDIDVGQYVHVHNVDSDL